MNIHQRAQKSLWLGVEKCIGVLDHRVRTCTLVFHRHNRYYTSSLSDSQRDSSLQLYTPPPFSSPSSQPTLPFRTRSPLPPLLSTAIPPLPSRRRPRVRTTRSFLLLPRRPRQESRHIKRPSAAGAALPRRGTHNAVHRVRFLPLLPLGAHLRVHYHRMSAPSLLSLRRGEGTHYYQPNTASQT